MQTGGGLAGGEGAAPFAATLLVADLGGVKELAHAAIGEAEAEIMPDIIQPP